MNPQSIIRQTRSQTRAQQVNADLDGDDRISEKSSDDPLVLQMIDQNGEESSDCVGCDRPNSIERYMVQCEKCNHWYHLTCANVTLDTVRSFSFVCVVCAPRGVSSALETTPSLISVLSSTSSARKAKLDRELLRLEEERKLLEDLNRERIEKERALNEREIQEKLERERLFIARKHELLSQHDGEECRSVRSMRSSQRSTKRTEDWVRQAEATENSKVVELCHPLSTSMSADHLGDPQVVHPSSTPLRAAISSVHRPKAGDNKDSKESEVISIPRTLGSITIGEDSEDSFEGIVKANVDGQNHAKKTSELPFVDLKPYADLLNMEEPASTVSNTGAMVRMNSFREHSNKCWSVEAGELRKQNVLQQEKEMERETIQKLTAKHELAIEIRRKRELELVNRISSLQAQYEEDLRLICESEEGLRCQLIQRDREQAALKNRIDGLESQLNEETERMRTSEADLRHQLKQRNQECESFQLQLKELENEIQCLREVKQQLQSRIDAGRQREHEAIRLRRVAEEEYWELHDKVEQFINGKEDQPSDSRGSPPLPPPPASWLGSTDAQNDGIPSNEQLTFAPTLPIPVDRSMPHDRRKFADPLGASSGTNMPVFLPSIPSLPEYATGSFGPSPQQLAARQVVTKELPIFSGDPTDWPLFISSYQHSTEACGYTSSENLLRLQRCLRGNAKDSVSSFLLHPSTVPQILSTLQQLYGRPEQIVSNMIAKVRATPPPKPDRLETLVSFGLVVQNLCGHLKAVGLERYLTNPILLQELVDKLPTAVKLNWALYQQQVPMADLSVFCDYMTTVSSAASGVSQLSNIPHNLKDERTRQKDRSFVNTHGFSEQSEVEYREEARGDGINDGTQRHRNSGSKRMCPACNIHSHRVENCMTFKDLDLDGKWEVIKMHKLCSRCLTEHTRWPCKGEVCGINDCSKRHHRLLHFDPESENVEQCSDYSSS